MKKLVIFLLLVLLCGCAAPAEPTQEVLPDPLNMNANYPACQNLEQGNGEKVNVIVLLGQSNASGCSVVACLEENISEQQFAQYQQGYERIRINYCIDDQKFTSGGEFVKTDLTCGCGEGFFGPEVGMAQELSLQFPQEQFFILKYTMSGYSLQHHWLHNGQRGDIYNACLPFLQTYMDALLDSGYDASIAAICWMQGESDTTEAKAANYLANQTALVSYLRQDLQAYGSDIWFIDAGISSSPYCEPAYPQVNQAKEAFAALSPWNVYFSTIDMGLTTLYEPEYQPDLGHYDSLSEIELGRSFGLEIAKALILIRD